jgi:hypothetical protein
VPSVALDEISLRDALGFLRVEKSAAAVLANRAAKDRALRTSVLRMNAAVVGVLQAALDEYRFSAVSNEYP